MWTLEEAIKDYENEPKCSNCEFMLNTIEYSPSNYRNYIQCKVKSKEVQNEDAVKCKYYTVNR